MERLWKAFHNFSRTKPLADSLVKTPSPAPPTMLRVSLAILRCPDHHDSPASMAWPQCHAILGLSTHKESPHEDHPPDDPLTAAHARRYADPQLLAPHHRRVSAQCRPVCQALPHLSRALRPGPHP